MATRDQLTADEQARVSDSTVLGDHTDDGRHVSYSVEHPTRLHDAFVAGNADLGNELVRTVNLGDGYCRCTYLLALPSTMRKVDA